MASLADETEYDNALHVSVMLITAFTVSFPTPDVETVTVVQVGLSCGWESVERVCACSVGKREAVACFTSWFDR